MHKFWRGIVLGALVGGAISLLDKQTRQSVVGQVKDSKDKFVDTVKNSGAIFEEIKDKTTALTTTVKEMSEDFRYITDKVEDLKELNPQVKELIQNTKEVFRKERGLNDEDNCE